MEKKLALNLTQKKEILDAYLRGDMCRKEAAFHLGVSIRQFCRIKNEYLQKGEEGLIHKNRGRQPWNKLSNDVVHTVKNYLEGEYKTLNLLEAHRELKNSKQVDISYSTLRRLRKDNVQ